MLRSSLSIALKEWSVVQRSLLRQHQILLIRKGGISEESGDFDLRAEQFLILPTYQHELEREGDLQPRFEPWLGQETVARTHPDVITIECACEVADILRVNDRELLYKLNAEHIWSRQFIDGRFDWEPYKPITAILVRAYQLQSPVLLPNLKEYGGCRSWVALDTPVVTAGAAAVIENDDSFRKRLSLTKELLSS